MMDLIHCTSDLEMFIDKTIKLCLLEYDLDIDTEAVLKDMNKSWPAETSQARQSPRNVQTNHSADDTSNMAAPSPLRMEPLGEAREGGPAQADYKMEPCREEALNLSLASKDGRRKRHGETVDDGEVKGEGILTKSPDPCVELLALGKTKRGDEEAMSRSSTPDTTRSSPTLRHAKLKSRLQMRYFGDQSVSTDLSLDRMEEPAGNTPSPSPNENLALRTEGDAAIAEIVDTPRAPQVLKRHSKAEEHRPAKRVYREPADAVGQVHHEHRFSPLRHLLRSESDISPVPAPAHRSNLASPAFLARSLSAPLKQNRHMATPPTVPRLPGLPALIRASELPAASAEMSATPRDSNPAFLPARPEVVRNYQAWPLTSQPRPLTQGDKLEQQRRHGDEAWHRYNMLRHHHEQLHQQQQQRRHQKEARMKHSTCCSSRHPCKHRQIHSMSRISFIIQDELMNDESKCHHGCHCLPALPAQRFTPQLPQHQQQQPLTTVRQ